MLTCAPALSPAASRAVTPSVMVAADGASCGTTTRNVALAAT